MSNANFKENFDESLQKLGQIKTAIEANIQSKKDFSGKIINRLSEINVKVQQLGALITELKKQLNALQEQTNSNNSQIGDKSKQVDNLTAQINQLTEEKTNALNELAQIKQKYTDDVGQKQS